jgi:hypothetical protein
MVLMMMKVFLVMLKVMIVMLVMIPMPSNQHLSNMEQIPQLVTRADNNHRRQNTKSHVTYNRHHM